MADILHLCILQNVVLIPLLKKRKIVIMCSIKTELKVSVIEEAVLLEATKRSLRLLQESKCC